MPAFAPPDRLRWLFLDLNSYFASVEQNENPALRGKPVAVLPLMSEGTCVIAASYEAKALGIKTGTRVWEARQLCPDITFISGRHDLYVDYHHRILAEVDRHIPVTDICSIDEVACRLDPTEQPRETAMALARRIKEGLRRNIGPAIRCSIGLAPSRLLAKIGTDMQKPDGLVVLEPHDLPARLLPLALTDLPGINTGMQRRLARGGVTSIEAFWHLDPRHARRLWGSVEGERYWYALHGYDFAEFGSERSSISHSQVLAPEVRPWNEARLVGRRLMQKAATRLRRVGLCAQHVALSFRTVEGGRGGLQLSLPEPTADNFMLLRTFDQLWDDASRQAGQPQLRKVGIWLTGLMKPEDVIADLFIAPQQQEADARHLKLSGIMDELNRKYGRDTLLLGMPAKKMAAYTGTKVAFNRIPDAEEFHE